MSLPCPQRDALEEVTQGAKPWPADEVKLNANTKFRLVSGEPLYLLGVSPGAGMRSGINLHIAVFSNTRPDAGWVLQDDPDLLKQCRLGGLITSVKGGWLSAQGLNFKWIDKGRVVLGRTRRSSKYRQI